MRKLITIMILSVLMLNVSCKKKEVEKQNTETKGYKFYSCLITQQEENDPVVTVLGENTIGKIVWTRLNIGVYRATLKDAFPVGKTFVVTSLSSITNEVSTITWGSISPNYIEFKSFNYDGVLSDSKLINASIEIRVYD